MKEPDLKRRTKRLALDVIKFVEALPGGDTCRVLGRQLLRAGTSAGANYRAANRAKSKTDFILVEDGKVNETKAGLLIEEANELVAIAVASINTARKSDGGRS